MSEEYRCLDCDETFETEGLARNHAGRKHHFVVPVEVSDE